MHRLRVLKTNWLLKNQSEVNWPMNLVDVKSKIDTDGDSNDRVLSVNNRLDSERLVDIEHAIHQLSDTDPQLIVELQNELAALSDRRETEKYAFAQFQEEQETSHTLVVQHESSSFEKKMVFCKVLKLNWRKLFGLSQRNLGSMIKRRASGLRIILKLLVACYRISSFQKTSVLLLKLPILRF